MLGSPLIRALAALAVLLLLVLPLRSFTSMRLPEALPPVATPVADATAHLEIVSTKFPFAFSVKHLGKVVWQGNSAGASAETDVRLPIPEEGVELALSVTWTGAETGAARLGLSHDDRDPIERTVWGNGQASDVLTFP